MRRVVERAEGRKLNVIKLFRVRILLYPSSIPEKQPEDLPVRGSFLLSNRM
jgi:hypothetical protein